MSDLEEKLSALKIGRPAAVTVGTFDGVHLGHRRLLGSLRHEADQAGLASVAVTFKEQPRALIDPSAQVTYLATLEHRTQLLGETGIDAVLPVSFDDSLRGLSAVEFLEMLKRSADVRLLIAGAGARLGNDRRDAAELARLAGQHGVRIVEIEAVRLANAANDATDPGGEVSSSAIRRALIAGDVKVAAQMLGRRHRVDGTVVTGDKRGRELGFPTANIEPEASLVVPADGIYATIINAAGKRRMAATSIGLRPTFGSGGARLIEAYILDFEGDLYGHHVQLEFVERLRGEVKFDGIKPLVTQMNLDVSEAREVLSGAV